KVTLPDQLHRFSDVDIFLAPNLVDRNPDGATLQRRRNLADEAGIEAGDLSQLLGVTGRPGAFAALTKALRANQHRTHLVGDGGLAQALADVLDQAEQRGLEEQIGV